MNNKTLVVLVFSLAVMCVASIEAEEHLATFLGNPSTRFAPPLLTPEDLRDRFRDPALQPDIASVLSQWGWNGNLEDLHRAAQTNEIVELEILVGTRMPFMSSRRGGKPVCLRNVVWAGKKPVSAYAFTFSSKGRRYRCVTPKPCSNFYLEDLGAPALSLACEAPASEVLGRLVRVCLTLQNRGDAAEPRAVITLPIPDGASYLSPSQGIIPAPGYLTWKIPNLAPNASNQILADFVLPRVGSMTFTPSLQGDLSETIQSACSTRIDGIPAVLLEVVDLEDPVEVGKEVAYNIKVTNQGSAVLTNIRLVCALPGSQEFISGTGITTVSAQGSTITMEPVLSLASKDVASWDVIVKVLEAADARFKVELRSDQFEKPIPEDESTRQY